MGLCLIATAWWADPYFWLVVLEVAAVLGLVIFVHELGHFAVAKLCGVKCEKFYLGFDIAGLRLCRFTWGETEYGIGILPLGGYVKMLGQEDNPARLREEIERAKQNQAGEQSPQPAPEDPPKQTRQPESERPPARQNDTEQIDTAQNDTEQIDVEAAEQALFDPRSYLAQSVPRRMAIISAGVVMNLIFAFVAAVIAFNLGVPRRPCRVGGLMPGQAAWQEGMEIGDQIKEIDGKKIEKFRDMQMAVSLSDNIEKGLLFVIRRPGQQDPLHFTVKPDSSGLLPRIGIFSPWTNSLRKEGLAFLPGSAAAKSQPGFEFGDEIVEIDGHPIDGYPQLHAYLAQHRDKPLKVTVRRLTNKDAGRGESDDAARKLIINVPPNPTRRLGLVMKMGPICAIQVGSPADKAGIEPGDKISKIDLQPPADRAQPPNFESPGDPLTLPDRLRRRAGQSIALLLEGDDQPKYVRLGPADRYEQSVDDDNPITVPELGIAYWVLNEVDRPIQGAADQPAAVPAGAKILRVKLIPPDKQSPREEKLEQGNVTIDFGEKYRNWPTLIYLLQQSLPNTRAEVTWTKGEKQGTTTLQSYPADDWPNPDRGFLFEPDKIIQGRQEFADSIRLGAKETTDATLMVYRTLQKLSTQQVSPRALGGPKSIFEWAMRAAEMGLPDLLIFLTLLSANLAVLNFLPIPLLDGGHMVFLTWEAVRGKPANERVQLVLTYIGLILILTLMVWVLGLDFGLIPRE